MNLPTVPLLALLAACSGEPPPSSPPPSPPPHEKAPAPSPASEPAEATPNVVASADEGADMQPNADLPELPAGAPQRIDARHILVAWQGAVGADPRLHRTRKEAWDRAQEALTRLKAGDDFAAVARDTSDDSTGPRGGDLGVFGRGAMQADFERAAFALKVGEVSGIVETPFGFHIIQREALDEVHVAHIVVQWAGLDRATTTRTKEEAHARIEEALARLDAGQDFASLAAEYSDGPTGARGGDLGWFQRGQMMPAFDAAAFSLEKGAHSGIIETPLGYHVIVRLD